ncbi:hypothetical protein CYMTET_49595 [Cymbomonas tetramitiformis]|uniref:Uncharacterized protein n=1 Tax=Cymbomonas tetramitiformis TaxID=36881 RepID=A0AAE0ETZ6_9CHLO|nr:hypothetical protein CYMTET_49595 [Cymbomonas tetramitiformis]
MRLTAWGKCKQQGAAAAALDDLWIESLDPHASAASRRPLRVAMLTLLQAKGVGSTHVGEGAMPAVHLEGMDQRGSCLPGGETSLDEGPHASGSSGSDPPAVSAAVDELLSSTPSSMLWGEGEGTRIKAEVRAFLNGLSHLLLEDEELDSEVRQGVDGFFEQLPSMSWEREGSAGEPRGAVEEMVSPYSTTTVVGRQLMLPAVLLPVLLHTVNGWRGAAEVCPLCWKGRRTYRHALLWLTRKECLKTKSAMRRETNSCRLCNY